MTFTIYTDGGCNPNPGPGGWAALIITHDDQERVLSGSDPDTTNNRMELTAALQALQALDGSSEVNLYTDSLYLRRGVTEWLTTWQRRSWKKQDGKTVLNRDLWEALARYLQKHQVTWHWVKGHANNPYNERVDRLASAAIPRVAQETSSGATRVYLRVSCVGQQGGWAARIVEGDQRRELSGRANATTSNRLELIAVLAILETILPDQPVEVHAASDYLYKGMTLWLPDWQKRRWRTSKGGPVKNADLWQELVRLNRQSTITWLWTRRDDQADETAGLDDLAAQARSGG